MQLLANIDVPDLERAIAFYTQGLGLKLHRRLGDGGAELHGAGAPIWLLRKSAGSRASSTQTQTRDYTRHWTPVHLDFVVDDVDTAVTCAVTAGAVLEDAAQSHDWGRIAHLADPFGHGFCLLQFLNRGYDELAEPL